MKIFLLQEPVSYLSSNTKGAALLFIALGSLIAIRIVVFLIKKNNVRQPKPARRNLSIFAFNRLARSYGLNRREKSLLRFVLQNNGVTDPEPVVRNPQLLDKYFKETYHAITHSVTDDAELNGRLSELFALRNILDTVTIGNPLTSTRQIKDGTPVVISANAKNYQAKVLFNQKERIMISCPQNKMGSAIQIAKGAAVTFSFLTGFNQGVSFFARFPEIRQTPFGLGIVLEHRNALKRLMLRKHRRRSEPAPCYFFLINEEQIGKGKKKKTKLVVNKQRIKADLMDISVGGCCIKSPLMVEGGSRLKILFSYSDNTIVCLGQVLRANKDAVSVILHIKFIKMREENRNAINALVFEFDE